MAQNIDQIQQRGSQIILIILGITVLFMLIQLIGGWIAGSLALMADAAHMGTDLIGYSVALFAIWLAKKPSSPRMSYGYYRAEILAATLSALLLWAVCGFLIFEAVRRILRPPEVKGGIVFIIASITLIFNLVTMALLRRNAKKNLNIKTAYIHVLSDLLGNLGVILAGGVIFLTGWSLFDPIITLLFTLLIIFSAWRMLGEATGILMEATPKHIDPLQVQEALVNISAIQEVHDLHIWTLSSGRVALSAHLVSPDPHQALTIAQKRLAETFGIQHATLQIETPDQFKREDCFDAAEPSTP